MSNPVYIAKEDTLLEVKSKIGESSDTSTTVLGKLNESAATVGESTDTGEETVMGKLNALMGGGEWQYIPGEILLAAVNNEKMTTSSADEVFYSQNITMGMGGTLVFKAAIKRTGSGTGYLNIYANDVLKGTAATSGTSEAEYSVEASFSKGDVIKISLSSSNGASSSAYSTLIAGSIKIYGNVVPKATFSALAFSAIS